MKPSKAIIGLYLSNTRIEAAQVAPDGSLAAYHAAVPETEILDEDGDIRDLSQAVEAIKAFWTAGGLQAKDVVLVPNTRKGIMRLLKLPRLPMDQLSQAILSEAEQFALFRSEDPLLDHFVAVPGSDFLQVCYLAMPHTVAERYQQVLAGAGLKLAGLELPQMAGQRGFKHYLQEGIDHWTGVQVLPGRLSVTFWMKEQLLAVREIQLPDWETVNIELLAQNYMPDVVRTVGREANVFLDDPHLVVASENLAEAKYLATYFGDMSGIPVLVSGPTDWEESFAEGRPVPSYLAMGAATWGKEGYVPSLDLFSKGKRRLKNPLAGVGQKIDGRMVAMGVATLVCALAIGFAGQIWSSRLTRTGSGLQAQISSLQSAQQSQDQLLKQTPPEETLLQQWVPLKGENAFALGFLRELRDITPADTWLTEVKYQAGQQISFTGGALHQGSGMYFAEALSRLPRIGQVKVVRLVRRGTLYDFEIWAGLQDPPQAPKQ